MLQAVAQALGELCDELVFVGGCAAGLLCTSPHAPPPRITYDVDVVAEVTALSAYHALEEKVASRGFTRDMSPDAPICRWRLGEMEVDLMPSDERILGFSNRWYPLAIASASEFVLPGGRTIRLISAPAFLATKLEAFATRGRGDLMSSHDFEDIVNVLEGRPGIEAEVTAIGGELSDYLAARFREIAGHPDFENTLPGLVTYDELHEDRIRRVRERINLIAARSVK
ncbi:MAG: nucleotidyl transferase AbiEii/AbiGii toxin family protein [Nitrosomonadales bacterium]|nr:nucleotidyl transferase AbiEii/AbiGii toxin family protein [Nitrosomonadales bacterium]